MFNYLNQNDAKFKLHRPGRGETVVINDVPARVCENCGEEYFDERVAERVLAAAEASARAGVRVEIRDYVAG